MTMYLAKSAEKMFSFLQEMIVSLVKLKMPGVTAIATDCLVTGVNYLFNIFVLFT